MIKRALGRSGLQIPPLTFGGNVFGWTVDEAGACSLLDAMVDAGLNFIDTADVYSRWAPGNQGGESETLIGKWIKRSPAQPGAARHQGRHGNGARPQGLAPAYIRQSLEASLSRLQTDYVDLYQSHQDDPDTPLTDTLGAYARLMEAGKVRHRRVQHTSVRLSEALIASERHNLPRYESVQPEYNLYKREGFESGLQSLVRAQDMGVINYYALASGFLSGKYRSATDAGKSARPQDRRHLSERARPAHPEGAGRSGRGRELHAGPGRAGLADRAARHHLAHRQRHLAGTTRRTGQGRQPDAQPRPARQAQPGQRLARLNAGHARSAG